MGFRRKQRDRRQTKERLKIFLAIIKFLILLCILLAVPLIIYWQRPDLVEQFQSMEGVNAFLDQYHTASVFIYIGLQIIQIVICFIPGQFIQFAAGYIYRFWIGYLLSIIGIFIGTVVTFYIAKMLGRDAIHLFLGKERVNRYVKILNSKKAFIVIFFLFVMPGFPKDLITYAAGLSEIKLKPFLIISLLGRTPALMGTIMMGAMLRTESYFGMIVLAVIAVAAFILCIIFRERLMKKLDIAYEKLIRS